MTKNHRDRNPLPTRRLRTSFARPGIHIPRKKRSALFWLGYGRRKYRSFVPLRGDRRELVLQLVEGIS